jgi:hypothetical protein
VGTLNSLKTRIVTSFGSFLLLSAMAPLANAGFVYFNLPGLHPGQSARVAEQIVCTAGCLGLDYQFYVLNTGVIGIDGVAFGLGVTPATFGAAIAGGALTIATANGGGDGPFPGVLAGNFGGTTVLGVPPNNPPLAAGPIFAWGFEEWQDAGTAGALPITFYITRWYSPIQGPGSNFLAPRRYTRLDLFSTFGPAGGTGAVDPPFDTLPFLGFDTIGGFDPLDGGATEIPQFNPDPNASADWSQPCNPITNPTTCTAGLMSDLNSDLQFAAGTFQQDPTPEPASIGLIAGGILAILIGKRCR